MIDVIYQLGDDALANFFQITIPTVSPSTGGSLDMANIVLRTTTIGIPQSGANSYNIPYKTQEITKVGGKVDLTKTFNMTLRVDRFYKEYEKILQWKNAVANPHTGVIGPDNIGGASNRVDIRVDPIDSNGEIIENVLHWILHHAFIKTVPDISFDYNSGDPISVNLGFEYTTLEEVFPT